LKNRIEQQQEKEKRNMEGNSLDALLRRKKSFNPQGDTLPSLTRVVGGNPTNLNDFVNRRYPWASAWYRQALNNFWIPEEISLSDDKSGYPRLAAPERTAYDKILSFLVFLDSLQSNSLPSLAEYVTSPEICLCLNIQAFQECLHSQSYSYMLDSICPPDKRQEILYQWKDDAHLLRRNQFIGQLYNDFMEKPSRLNFIRALMGCYILEGIYFYSGFSFFYSLERRGLMTGSAQEIRYINRDENTHLWLFRSIFKELMAEEPGWFTDDTKEMMLGMLKEGVRQEREWGAYVIGNSIPGLSAQMVSDYIAYLGNLRWQGLGFAPYDPEHKDEPESMRWVSQHSDSNAVKADFFEARVTAYAKSASIVDDL
jgi:ribonucleoside-diphosphate reductase beta chain